MKLNRREFVKRAAWWGGTLLLPARALGSSAQPNHRAYPAYWKLEQAGEKRISVPCLASFIASFTA